jgi:ribosomal protein S5
MNVVKATMEGLSRLKSVAQPAAEAPVKDVKETAK